MNNKEHNLINIYFSDKQRIDWMVIRSEVILAKLYPITYRKFINCIKENKHIQFELTYDPRNIFITFYASCDNVHLPILIAFAEDFIDHPLQIIWHALAVYYGFGVKYGIISILTRTFSEDEYFKIADKIFTHYGLKVDPSYRREFYYE